MQLRISLYLDKDNEYYDLRDEIKKLWYEEFGENLSNTKIIMKALKTLRGSLIKERKNANKGQDLYKYTRFRR